MQMVKLSPAASGPLPGMRTTAIKTRKNLNRLDKFFAANWVLFEKPDTSRNVNHLQKTKKIFIPDYG